MSLTDNKISTWTNPIGNEADQPQRTASEMKAVFDANSNELKTALNALIDDLVGSEGSAEIGSAALDDVDAGTLYSQLVALRELIDERVETISIGTVTTGAAGSSASVSVSGTLPNLELNFTIPKGDAGDPAAAHAAQHASDGDDPVSPASIGALEAVSADIALYVATTGDDSNPGTSGEPFATIQKAIDSTPRNMNGYRATVYIAAGTYTENITVANISGGSVGLCLTGNVIINGYITALYNDTLNIYGNNGNFGRTLTINANSSTSPLYAQYGMIQLYQTVITNVNAGSYCTYAVWAKAGSVCLANYNSTTPYFIVSGGTSGCILASHNGQFSADAVFTVSDSPIGLRAAAGMVLCAYTVTYTSIATQTREDYGGIILANRRGISSVDYIAAGSNGNLTLSAVKYASQALSASEQLQARQNINAVAAPATVSDTGSITVTMADNTEYTYTGVTSLAITGAAVNCHGWITFDSSTPTVTDPTGFSGESGDDIADGAASEVWEFNCENGYIVWKNWGA